MEMIGPEKQVHFQVYWHVNRYLSPYTPSRSQNISNNVFIRRDLFFMEQRKKSVVIGLKNGKKVTSKMN